MTRRRRCMWQLPKRSKNTGCRNKLSLQLVHQKLSRLRQGKLSFSHWAQAASQSIKRHDVSRFFVSSSQRKENVDESPAAAKQADALWLLAAWSSNVAGRQLHFQDTRLKEKAQWGKINSHQIVSFWMTRNYSEQGFAKLKSPICQFLNKHSIYVPKPGDRAFCWLFTADPELWWGSDWR